MRDRMLRKGFFEDEKLAQVPFGARILFEGMWAASDDYGVVKGHPVWLKGQIFPYDEISAAEFKGWLSELARFEFVIPFSSHGETFYIIVHWYDHQKVDHPSKWKNPEPPEEISQRVEELRSGTRAHTDHSSTTRRGLAEDSPRTRAQVKLIEVNRREEKGSTAAPISDIPSSVPSISTTLRVREKIIVKGLDTVSDTLSDTVCNGPENPEDEPEPTAEDLAALEDEAAAPTAAGAPAAADPPESPSPAQEPATMALTPPDGAKRGRPKREKAPDAPTWPEELLDIFAFWHERIMGGIPFHRRKKDKLSGQAGDVAAYLRTFKGADGAPKDTAEIRDIYIRFVCVYLCEPAGGDAKADWEHYTPQEHTFGFFASTLPRWAMAAQGNIHRVKDPPDLWKKKNNGAFFVSPTSRDLWPRAVQVQIEEIRGRGDLERAEMDRALDLFTSHRTLEDFTAGGKVGDAGKRRGRGIDPRELAEKSLLPPAEFRKYYEEKFNELEAERAAARAAEKQPDADPSGH